MAGAIIRHACKASTHWIANCCEELRCSNGCVLLHVYSNTVIRYWTSVTLPFTNVTFKSLYT